MEDVQSADMMLGSVQSGERLALHQRTPVVVATSKQQEKRTGGGKNWSNRIIK